MNALSVASLWKYYGDYPALRDISFAVQPGSCLALLGRNGAGKTTLLRILAGLSRPTRGSVSLFEKDHLDREARSLTGIIGHGIGIYDELTAYENLRLFADLYSLENPHAAAIEWLERTSLDTVAHSRVREFSRGMRQRLAVARAFLHRPKLLLLDEPFTALDDRAIALLQSLLRESLESGGTVVMSTHQLREAMELASDVALLVRGKLAHTGPRSPEMLADTGYLYRTYGEAS
jgi:heme ABC exporter ATP-binding subunit CcmA